MSDAATPPAPMPPPPARPRWRLAAWGLGKWLAAILGLVLVPQILFAGYRVARSERDHVFEIDLTRLRAQAPAPSDRMLERSVLAHLRDVRCTPPTPVAQGEGTTWRTRCSGTERTGTPRVAEPAALRAAGWAIAGLRGVPAALRAPRITDLVPPWWLLLATSLPALFLLRHDWRADLGARWRQPFATCGWLLLPVATSVLVGMAAAASGAEREGLMTTLQAELAARPDRGLMLAIALFAPLLEEMVFRGLGWRWLRPAWGVAGTLLVTSVVFVGLHAGQYAGAGLVLVAFLALAFGVVRERTGSLLLCVGGHALVNGFAVAALLAGPSG